MKKFAFVGNASYSNRGCEAIVRSSAQVLEDTFGSCNFVSHYFQEPYCRDAEIEKDSRILHDPFPAIKRYSINWISDVIRRRIFHQPRNVMGIKKVLQKKIDVIDAYYLLGGDTLSLDYGKPDHQLEILRILNEHQKKCIIWGASVGPFSNNAEYEKLIVNYLQTVDLICARESLTRNYLRELGLNENVILTADPAFCLKPQIVELPTEIEKILEKGCIGLNLSPLIGKSIFGGKRYVDNQEQWLKLSSIFLENLIRKIDLPILLIPHVITYNNDEDRDDYIFLSKLIKNNHLNGKVFILNPTLNAGQLKYVISRVEIFIGARTHSTIAAMSSCVPTICIGYSVKAKGIAKDIYGNQNWLIQATSLKKPEFIIEKIVDLFNQRNTLRAQLQKIIPVMEKRVLYGAEISKKVID